MTNIRLTLIDNNPGMVEAWKAAFAPFPEVSIVYGDIFQYAPYDAVISPANSFGYMDGGIDNAYRTRFGLHIETDVLIVIRAVWAGHLPVGAAQVIHTGDKHPSAPVPRLVVAPTMHFAGQDISKTENAHLSFSAAMMAVNNYNRISPQLQRKPIITLTCPGLGTGVGKMSFENCAMQMSRVWEEFHRGRTYTPREIRDIGVENKGWGAAAGADKPNPSCGDCHGSGIFIKGEKQAICWCTKPKERIA